MTDGNEPAARLSPADAPSADTATSAEMATWWLQLWRQEQARGAVSEMAWLMGMTYTFLDRFEKYSGDEHFIYAVAAMMEQEDLMREELFSPDRCRSALFELEMLNTKIQQGLVKSNDE